MATQKKARSRVKKWIFALLIVAVLKVRATEHILVIQGAGGESQYEQRFAEVGDLWVTLGEAAGAELTRIGSEASEATAKQRIQDWITSPERAEAESVWLVYLGHGTSNSGGTKMNLTGPDLSTQELGEWIKPLPSQLVFIHGGSASAPLIASLSGENRIIVTATRSGNELNYARFGEQFAYAFADPQSDIDLDGSVSLLEAFIHASNSVERFYREAGRLSTEHALIDDNGDARGTPATQFSGLRPKENNSGIPTDGRLASRLTLSSAGSSSSLSSQQAQERDQLEKELETIYSKKDAMSEELYYEELEKILSKLARLYLVSPDS